MKFYDFEYDGIILSSLGYMICKFNSEGLNTVSNGSQIDFELVSVDYGAKQELTGYKYDECLEATFQICKNPCEEDNLEISKQELRDLMSWLNRKNFYKLKFLDDDYLDVYFEASFNISRIESNGQLVGLELNVKTNRPFALMEEKSINIVNNVSNGRKTFTDLSDDEGYIYPKTIITIKESGNLSIYNELDDRTTYIANCTAGEVITMEYPIIESSLSSHQIQNDFNWNFLRIVNTFKNKKNKLTISIPCTIKMTYSPIVKMGI